MRHRLLAVAAGVIAAHLPSHLVAQTVRFAALGAYGTYQEATTSREWRGAGYGGSAEVVGRKLRLEGAVTRFTMASVAGPLSGLSSMHVLTWDARAGLGLGSSFWLEAGGGRLTADPKLAAQDMGFVRVGLLSESRFSRNADVWARAAYLPVTRYSGGGSARMAVELGFGIHLGLGSGRFHVRAAYQFQRMDRTVRGRDVPIQTTSARLGIGAGF